MVENLLATYICMLWSVCYKQILYKLIYFVPNMYALFLAF